MVKVVMKGKITYQCLHCLRVRLGTSSDWSFCDVILPYSVGDTCERCREENEKVGDNQREEVVIYA